MTGVLAGAQCESVAHFAQIVVSQWPGIATALRRRNRHTACVGDHLGGLLT